MVKILIIDDSGETEALLRQQLPPGEVEIAAAADAPKGVTEARRMKPDIVFMDLSLPGIPAWKAIRWLKNDAELASVPVIAMGDLALGGDSDRALAAGCNGFLPKPVTVAAVRRILAAFLPGGEPQDLELTRPLSLRTPSGRGRSRIFVLSADEKFLHPTVASLKLKNYLVRSARSREEAIEAAKAERPDLFLIDSDLGLEEGLDAIAPIRTAMRERFLPIIYLAPSAEEGVRGYRAGADDFLVKPVHEVELAARLHSQILLAKMLRLERQRTLELGTVMTHLSQGVVLFDEEGRVTLMNSRAAEILGVPARGIHGRSSRHLFRLARLCNESGEAFGPDDDPIQRLRRDGEGADQRVLQHQEAGSTSMRLEIRTVPIVGGRRRLRGFAIFVRPLLEEPQWGRDLVEAYARLMEVDQLKSKFLSTVSHELRTPLNTIILLSHLLTTEKPGARSEEKKARDLRIIRQSATTLLHMINNLLDLAKIQAGQREVQATTVSLPAILEEVLEILRPQAETKNIALALRIRPEVPEYAVLDREKLRQILINLVSNGIKYTSEGAVELEAGVSPAGASLDFRIRDSGMGIPPEKLPLIFEPFRQIASGGNSDKGSGLGLSIVKELVHLMGGDVTVTSAPGSGTVFQVTLPLVVPSGEVDETTLTRIPRPSRKRRCRILVVEDDVNSRYGLKRVLETEGYEADDAATGAQAREMLETTRYDAVFMDISLPDVEGTDLIGEIRKRQDLAHVPILALTGKTSDADRRDIAAAGATAYLSKPVDVRAMLRELGIALQAPAPEVEPPVSRPPARNGSR
jgi:signal transduction histidine kinase